MQTATTRTHEPRRRTLQLNVWAIRSEADYERTRQVVDDLILRPRLAPEERERMEVMLTLMEAYEDEHHRIDTSELGPIEVLKNLMEEHRMTASELGRLLGSRSLGSLILNGKRELSKTHIRVLAKHFVLDPGIFF